MVALLSQVVLSKREQASRSGIVSAEGEAGDFGAPLADVQAFLNDFPDARNINGSPETTAAKFAVNMGIDITENTDCELQNTLLENLRRFPLLSGFLPRWS